MDILSKIGTFLDGKKSYIISIIAGILGILTAMGHPTPEWVYIILGAFGLGAVRSAIGNK